MVMPQRRCPAAASGSQHCAGTTISTQVAAPTTQRVVAERQRGREQQAAGAPRACRRAGDAHAVPASRTVPCRIASAPSSQRSDARRNPCSCPAGNVTSTVTTPRAAAQAHTGGTARAPSRGARASPASPAPARRPTAAKPMASKQPALYFFGGGDRRVARILERRLDADAQSQVVTRRHARDQRTVQGAKAPSAASPSSQIFSPAGGGMSATGASDRLAASSSVPRHWRFSSAP